MKSKSGVPIPPEVRLAVERRDVDCQAKEAWGHTCRGVLVLHHRLPRSRGGKHTLENLVLLCPAAHDYVHGHPAWARDNGFLLATTREVSGP
jgi:5-methylcytosine-specific restriction endonuclease McrA